MHDISPRVIASKKYVYCHNPSPFYKIKKRDWIFGFKICLFTLLYRYTYQFNIKSNTAVFVQQNWIKSQFESWFKIKNCKVAYPETKTNQEIEKINLEPNKFHFFYPSFPRMFKNFEYLFDAILLLPNDLKNKVQLHVTIAGNENLYSKTLFKKYSKHPQFKFIGAINRTTVAGYYNAMDALIFPSKLETWGLPITETKEFEKSIFVANLPYAKETIGNYNKTIFFDLKNPQDLTSKLVAFMNSKPEYSKIKTASYKPDFTGWESIFKYIFND
jgi:glycosyltransferase involved in cell wall biosynthesis